MSGHESTDVIFHVMGCEILPHISLDTTLPKILATVSGPISFYQMAVHLVFLKL